MWVMSDEPVFLLGPSRKTNRNRISTFRLSSWIKLNPVPARTNSGVHKDRPSYEFNNIETISGCLYGRMGSLGQEPGAVFSGSNRNPVNDEKRVDVT